MQSLGTRFSVKIGSVKLVVGLNDLEDLLQLKGFHDSMITIT